MVIIDVNGIAQARKVADAVRLMKVSVQEPAEAPCRFTLEQMRQRIAKAEKDISDGKFISHDDIRRKSITR
jgi:hypothetical protein